MDGFDPSTGVIVIGATNRPEVLDPALLRPGRFDRRIVVQPPDRLGRELILEVHTRGMPLAPGVDLGRLAATTPGMVGADLANLANEAALLAARRRHERITMADFSDSLERIVLGAERKIVSRTRIASAPRTTRPGMRSSACSTRTRIRSGRSRSSRAASRSESRSPRRRRIASATTRSTCARRSKVALGGRVAEEIVFGVVTTGAESDIAQLTESPARWSAAGA